MRFLIVAMSIAAAVACAACDVDHPRAADAPPAAAVAPAGTAPAPVTPLPTPSAKDCDATAAEFAHGKFLTPALAQRARVRAGAKVVRIVRPGRAITLEFLASRLTLRLDEKGNVIGVDCG